MLVLDDIVLKGCHTDYIVFQKKNERIENKKVASDGRELVEIFNGYF